jgi:preprotein translocase subunit SecD
MTASSIRSATAKKNQTGEWVVDYTTTSSGRRTWDRVAEENFHLPLAIELNGLVYSAPIIQPTQVSFSSFDGTGEISGALTKTQATHLAAAMNTHRR